MPWCQPTACTHSPGGRSCEGTAAASPSMSTGRLTSVFRGSRILACSQQSNQSHWALQNTSCDCSSVQGTTQAAGHVCAPVSCHVRAPQLCLSVIPEQTKCSTMGHRPPPLRRACC